MGAARSKWGLQGCPEGPTHVDAVLLNRATGLAVFFEVKVLSDISVGVTFDPLRNHLARTVHVLLDSNRLPRPPPHRVCPRRAGFGVLRILVCMAG